jgi:thermitase
MKKCLYVFFFTIVILIGGASYSPPTSQAEAISGEYVPNQLIVKLKGEKALVNTQDLHNSLGAEVVSKNHTLGIEVVQFKGSVKDKIKSYQSHPDVEYAEPNYYFHAFAVPNDPYFNNQYGLKKIQAPQAWDQTIGSPDTMIAIVDSGVQRTHPDLASKVVNGYDYVDNDNTPNDENGHGTHCAGITGAIANNNIGVAGVAPGSTIYAVRVLDRQNNGELYAITQGIVEAADSGAKVINLSLGSPNDAQVLKQAVQYAWNRGAVIVVAAGNTGNTQPNYPAYYNEVISVASTDQFDRKSPFSNYGSWVDVAAPGSNIYSTFIGNTFRSMDGTSMAAPHVSGLAALLADQGFSNIEIRQIIEQTSDKINGTGVFWRNGRINANEAIKYSKQLKVR